MLAMTTATVTAATLTSTTTVTPTTVTAAALKAAGMVETAAMAEIAAMKAAIVVEPAAKPKPDPDANGNCVAVSAIIRVIRFGISVGGRLIIGSIGRSGGCAGKAGCKSAHDSLRVGDDLLHDKRNDSGAYSRFEKISAQTSPRRRRRPDAE